MSHILKTLKEDLASNKRYLVKLNKLGVVRMAEVYSGMIENQEKAIKLIRSGENSMEVYGRYLKGEL